MANARSWSTRCMHEASLWDYNCFITLTYAPEHLPPLASLRFEDFQKFMKRLRFTLKGVQNAPGSDQRPIRYFGCGEYGDTTSRPHYHFLLFNCRFEDQKPFDKTTFTSATLQKLWPYGHSLIGNVSRKSVQYVAGYAAKKMYGPVLEKFLEVVDAETGEVLGRREPQFAQMSLKPGIGQWWYDRYKRDLKHGYVVDRGKEQAIPRFYRKKFADEFPLEYGDLKAQAREYNPDMEPDRLAVDEIVKTAGDIDRKHSKKRGL